MCNKCGIREKSGRSGLCKECKNEYNKAHYRANKEYYIDRAKAAAKAARAKINKLKEDTPCTDCGVNYPGYVMDFDHLGNKEFNIAHGLTFSKTRLEAELAKCEIVCANCHIQRTHSRL